MIFIVSKSYFKGEGYTYCVDYWQSVGQNLQTRVRGTRTGLRGWEIAQQDVE